MIDYLDLSIRLQEERVRYDRKAFYTQLGLVIFNITLCVLNFYLAFQYGKPTASIAIGVCGINSIWCLAFCIDFGLDYFGSKKYLQELHNIKGKELIKLDINVIKMKQ